jgi:hypothetical protein
LEGPGEIFALVFLCFLRDEALGLVAGGEGATPFRAFRGGEIIVIEMVSQFVNHGFFLELQVSLADGDGLPANEVLRVGWRNALVGDGNVSGRCDVEEKQ